MRWRSGCIVGQLFPPFLNPALIFDVPSVTLNDDTAAPAQSEGAGGSKGWIRFIIYADKSNGGNFEHLTGFIPRFEGGATGSASGQ